MRVAVVTPYCREADETLRRCLDSVARQTRAATHYLVADGHPNALVAAAGVEHIVLPKAHGDNGNTPRSIGAISALNQGYDAVAFLDADNWYAPDHVETMIGVCETTGCAIALANRHIVLPDGTLLPFDDREDIDHSHVDTSCFFITTRAAVLMPLWAMFDQATSAICDRMMLCVIQARAISHEWSNHKTVYFESRYGHHYRAMGRDVPTDAHNFDWQDVAARYSDKRSIERLGYRFRFTLGVQPDKAAQPEQADRNAPLKL